MMTSSDVKQPEWPMVRLSLLSGWAWLPQLIRKVTARRRARKELASLDDRLLQDIGVRRPDIDHLVDRDIGRMVAGGTLLPRREGP